MAQLCTCVLAGVFRDIVVSRKGLQKCPVATGGIFAVNVGVRGNPGAALKPYCQDLLVSMQARQPTSEPSKHLGAQKAGSERVCRARCASLWLC